MQQEEMKFDCRYFDGSKPCQSKAICLDCDFYQSIGKRILLIKLASSGDVLRTTAILPALRKKYPDSYITWLVREPAQELLELNSAIDRILLYNLESTLTLQAERFDLVISLDKAVEAAALAVLVNTEEKLGFGLNEYGKIYPFNKGAEYSFRLGLDDDLKFRKNKKTYQELIFETAKLNYAGEKYELKLEKKELDFAEDFFKNNNLNNKKPVIGINTGAGKIFANKNLKTERIIELIRLLNRQLEADILLLGGPREKEINGHILENIDGVRVVDGGCNNSLKNFAALVNKCSLIITTDTLALHIAVALNKPTIALFGPTCHQEIDLYNRGRKIITSVDCAPCYKNKCNKRITCMDRISFEKILEAAKNLLEFRPTQANA